MAGPHPDAYAAGSLLAQVRVSASASTVFTATLTTEVMRVVVVNTTAADGSFRLFHADSAQEYSAGCALEWNHSLSAHTAFHLTADGGFGSGIIVGRSGRIGGYADNDTMTFSLYGITEDVAV